MRSVSIPTLAILAACLAVAPPLSAQTPGAGRGGPGRLQAKALEGITLTATQQTTIDSINARYRSQMPAFEPGSPPSDADRQKMRALLAASQKEVRAVLAPDQQAVYDKNIAALQRRFQGGGPAPGAPRNP